MTDKPDAAGVEDKSELTERIAGYEEFLRDIRARLHAAQVQAALAVNRELVLLYWQVGSDISQRMQEHGWGSKVVDKLSADLRREFPGVQGFSPRNLRYIRSFAEAWPDETILQQVVAKLPWGHNVRLLDHLNVSNERLWYAQQTLENGWSRNVLVHQIETDLYKRQGKPSPISNAPCRLPSRIWRSRS